MSTNTPINEAEIKYALDSIRRPDFRIWVRWAYVQGQLDLLAQGIIMSGKASNHVEAILYMAEHMKAYSQNGGKVTWGDVSKTPQSTKLQRTLSELITGEKTYGEYDLSRIHGTIGHNAIPDLFSGRLLKIGSNSWLSEQLEFFPKEISYNLFGEGITSKVLKKPRRRGLSIKVIDQTIDLWEELRDEISANKVLMYGKKFKKLRQNINVIFGEHASKITSHKARGSEYLSFLTFMTWAGALATYKISGSFHLFREISVFPYSSDMGAGRIDALSVLSMDKESLKSKQLETINKMTNQHFPSVGHLIRDLRSNFDAHLELVIRDWKFAVGDGPRSMRKGVSVLNHDEMKEKPLREHEEQIKRYLSTTVLSHSLVSKIDIKDAEKIWETKLFNLKGQIIYLTPDNHPAIHEFTLDTEEIKSVFQEQVVLNFTSAERRSLFRRTSNALMNHAIKLFSGNGVALRKQNSGQIVMDEILSSVEVKDASKNSVSAVVEQYRVRKFKDDFGIIEVVGMKKGKELLEMHLDRLFKAIDDEKIEVGRGTNWAKEVKICCLLHNEKTPSMNVSFTRGIFKCFGCDAVGGFAPLSIPDDVQVLIKPASTALKENSATAKLVIPLRHQEIMRVAEELLQQNFLNSSGARYLAEKRGLDPTISFSLGAGFGTENLIAGLLERGFSYGELIHYGFLGISEKVRESGRIIQILRNRGFALEDIIKPAFTKQRGGELKREPGLPFSFLENRVTYPLDIKGIINSFYGRSVDPNCDKKYAHFKLYSENTGMPHGAFNLGNAASSGSSGIVVEEAPINADTLIQHGDKKEVTAIIGVNNKVLWEELADVSGDIIISFNNDKERLNKKGKLVAPTGQRNTILLTEALREKGFKGQIYDFTAGFLKKNPGIEYNDPNQYWTDYKKPISIMESIKNA